MLPCKPGFAGSILREKDFSVDNLLVRIHFIIVIIRWTGLAPCDFEFPFPGSLTYTFLVLYLVLLSAAPQRHPMPPLPSPCPRGCASRPSERDPAHLDVQPERRKTSRMATLGRPQQPSPRTSLRPCLARAPATPFWGKLDERGTRVMIRGHRALDLGSEIEMVWKGLKEHLTVAS